METEKIWNGFSTRLLAFINGKVNNREIAQDILQDTFLKIHLKLDTVKDSKKLTSWIYQLTRNSIVDHFRKQKIGSTTNFDFDKLEEFSDETERSSMESCLVPFMNALDPKYKDAIEKTELGNLSQLEYAKELGISDSGAKSRVQRAKSQLKQLFVTCCQVGNPCQPNKVADESCGC